MASRQTRAGFLGTGAAVLGGAALAGAWRVDQAAAIASIKGESQPFVEGLIDPRLDGDAFFFELDGAPVGVLQSGQGGVASADIVVEKIGPDHIAKKHIANLKYEDISVSFGTGMSKGFYDWIKSSFDGKFAARTGAIRAVDTNLNARGTGEFTNALITEIGFPALDASSKDPAYMTLKFAPEITRFKAASGPAKPGGSTPAGIGAWKLEIDGLPTSRVSKIESFTVKQARATSIEPTKLEIPNLAFALPPDDAQPWVDYFDSFVIKGNSGDDKERGGSLQFLASDLSTPLFTLTFKHVGIFKLAPDKLEAGSESIRRVKAELYCEEMTFDYGAGTSG